MKLKILGTGNAGGVPLYGCRCHACIRANASTKYRRGPASALLQTEQGRLLIDAGLPELGRRFPAGGIDTILLTHYHMDHVQGLFPIRWGRNHPLQVIGPDDPVGCDDLFKHPGVLDFKQKANAFERFPLMNMSITPLPLQHSRPTLGYAIQHGQSMLAYLSDTYGLPDESAAWLSTRNIDLAVIDCSFPPTTNSRLNHNDLDTALAIVETIRPRRTLLTHISHLLDDWFMDHPDTLPKDVTLAWDGLTVQI